MPYAHDRERLPNGTTMRPWVATAITDMTHICDACGHRASEPDMFFIEHSDKRHKDGEAMESTVVAEVGTEEDANLIVEAIMALDTALDRIAMLEAENKKLRDA